MKIHALYYHYKINESHWLVMIQLPRLPALYLDFSWKWWIAKQETIFRSWDHVPHKNSVVLLFPIKRENNRKLITLLVSLCDIITWTFQIKKFFTSWSFFMYFFIFIYTVAGPTVPTYPLLYSQLSRIWTLWGFVNMIEL